MNNYDAIIVGSGPNGLAAAITLQQAGLRVLVLEGSDTIGGGLRTKPLTLPGYMHDVCSAIHPMAATSPFFAKLPLREHGLEFIYPPVAAAHPFDDGTAAVLQHSLAHTAQLLDVDAQQYTKLVGAVVNMWPDIVDDILGPLHFPQHPLTLARFGMNALLPATTIAKRFASPKTKGLWAGMAAHAIQPLDNATTAAIGLVLMAAGHLHGWPVPKGGSVSIANALASYFTSLGGKIETGRYVQSFDDLPAAKAILLDVTPRQLLKMAGNKLGGLYKWQLEKFRYGMGVFKIDWALSHPIPFTAAACRQAGTVHLGATLEEIELSEKLSSRGRHAEKPFVLLAQPSLFDDTRAPSGCHTAWAYCHVPHGSTQDMTDAIENQVERFAPGFKDCILARHTFNTVQMEAYNPNYIGGDINGGILDWRQLYSRPAVRISPYSIPLKGVYICSSSTPPGGGVHGMCGYHAARKALKDVFGLTSK
jgi:Phytoene dehydrogenase and related proteins